MIVDVVIPTFQETERLFRAVDSALNQTVPVDNIFVVDGGSNEEITYSMRRHFEGQARVHLVFMSYTGLPGVGREKGIRLSKADWVAFLDADDVWEPTKIEQQLAFAEATQSRFVCTNARKLKGGVSQGSYFLEGSVPKRLTSRDLVADNKVITSSVMADRELLMEVGVFASTPHVRAVEDYATWLRCISITSFSYIDTPLVDYEISELGLSAGSVMDARIFAISDFLVWLKTTALIDKKTSKRLRTIALKQLKSRF